MRRAISTHSRPSPGAEKNCTMPSSGYTESGVLVKRKFWRRSKDVLIRTAAADCSPPNSRSAVAVRVSPLTTVANTSNLFRGNCKHIDHVHKLHRCQKRAVFSRQGCKIAAPWAQLFEPVRFHF